MTRTLLLAALLSGIGGIASAQEPARDLPGNGGAGLRTGNITATGATVPNPGEPQSSGTTPLDRGIQRENQKITDSICKGC